MPRILNKHIDFIPDDAVYCGRGSPFGNPYIIGKDGDRDECCDKFDTLVDNSPSLQAKIRRELKDRDVWCFCWPKRCHCLTLIKYANKED